MKTGDTIMLISKDNFKGNIFDPRKRGQAKRNISDKLNPVQHKKALKWFLDYIQEVDLGPPMATEKYSVEELAELGYIGMYERGARHLFENEHVLPNIDFDAEYTPVTEDIEIEEIPVVEPKFEPEISIKDELPDVDIEIDIESID
jgi:hypothetical protein